MLTRLLGSRRAREMKEGQFSRRLAEPPRYWFRVVLSAVFVILVSLDSFPQSNRPSRIDLHRTFEPDYACFLYARPIQFLSETELVLMSGPSENCYRSVGQLELNVVSLGGQILSRKHCPQLIPGVVMAQGRLVQAVPDGFQVVNGSLAVVESVVLAGCKDRPPAPSIRPIQQEGTVTVAEPLCGRRFLYGGTPLKLLDEDAVEVPPANNARFIFRFADGQKLMKDGSSLIEVNQGSPTRTVASLGWAIPPCKKYEYCQGYDAPAYIQASTGKSRRILVFSNGSRFPVTDAAGLFPYFRLQVFDLITGAEIYREEHSFRTAQRSASLSPDGDLLAVFDGKSVVVHELP